MAPILPFKPITDPHQIKKFLSLNLNKDASKFPKLSPFFPQFRGPFEQTSSISNPKMQEDVYEAGGRIKTKAVVTQEADGSITVKARTYDSSNLSGKEEVLKQFVKSDTKNSNWILAKPQKYQSFWSFGDNHSISILKKQVEEQTRKSGKIDYREALDGFRALQRATRERQATTLPIDAFRHAVQTKRPEEALRALEQGARISSRDPGPGEEDVMTRLKTYSQDPDAQRWLGRKMINAMTKKFEDPYYVPKPNPRLWMKRYLRETSRTPSSKIPKKI
jgi:hypothetical protein